MTSYPSSQLVPDMIEFFNLYGPTVGSVEHEEWKAYRRIVTAGFNADTHAAVWKETLSQADAMVRYWEKKDGGKIEGLMKPWTCRLTLHVISKIFFGRGLRWGAEGKEMGEGEGEEMPTGHKMRYEEALFMVLKRLGMLYIVPHALLRSVPLKRFREAWMAFEEWTAYMKEMVRETAAKVEVESQEGGNKRNKRSLLGRMTCLFLCLALWHILDATLTICANTNTSESMIIASKPTPDPSLNPSSSSSRLPLPPISESALLGNTFFLLLAGHETTGNTLSFLLLLLALYPIHQSAIHNDLLKLLSIRPLSTWTLDQEYTSLTRSSNLSNFIKETLRVYCVVQFIARRVVKDMPVIDAQGMRRIVPAGTVAMLDFSAALRNPEVWQATNITRGGRRGGFDGVAAELGPEVLDSPAATEFDPDRWLEDQEEERGGARVREMEEAFFPFAQGPRVCPGRQFAMVEIVATVVAVLMEWRLELVVEKSVVEKCGGDGQKAWDEARKVGFRRLKTGVKSNITMEVGEVVPVKAVRR